MLDRKNKQNKDPFADLGPDPFADLMPPQDTTSGNIDLRPVAESTAVRSLRPLPPRPSVPSNVPKRGQGGIVNSLIKGVAYNFADESLGAIGALTATSPGSNYIDRLRASYKTNRKYVDDRQKEYAEDSPKTNFAGEMVGGAVASLATGGTGATPNVLRAVSGGGKLLSKLSPVIREGITSAALAGAGEADGSLAKRAVGAAKSGLAGGIFSAVIPGGKATVQGVRNIAGSRTGTAAAKRADDIVIKALERDGIGLDDLLRMGQSKAKLGKPHILADLGGENLTGVARVAQGTPSKAKEELAARLYERHQQQMERLTKDISKGIQVSPTKDADDVAEKLIRRRRGKSAPLYEEAYASPPIDDPEVLEVLQLPAFKKAYKRAQRIASLEGTKLPGLSSVSEDGAVELLPQPIQAIDYVKRGLNDVIESGMKKGSMGRTEARALKTKLKDLLALVDSHAPIYKEARNQYSSDSDVMEALDMGRTILGPKGREATRKLRKMSDGEKQLFKAGAMDAVNTSMSKAKDGRDLTKQIFGDKETRRRVRALFDDDESYQKFANSLKEEARMVRTKNQVLGGSVTFRGIGEMADMAGANVGELSARLAQGESIRGILASKAAEVLKRRSSGNIGNVADELSSRMLMDPTSKDFQDYIKELMRRVKQKEAMRELERATAGGLGVGVGSTVPNL